MKRFIIAVIVLVSLGGGSLAFAQSAQSQGVESDLTYINVSLERIWAHRLGYVVQYRRAGIGGRVARVYIPADWFMSGDGRAQIVALPQGPSWPSMSVFFRGGEFSHVKLYVHRSPLHQTWGSVPMATNIDAQFDGVESIEIQF